jgi:hypothetical protein
MSVSVIPQSQLESLWEQNSIAVKRASGALQEIITYSTEARNPAFAGGRSLIIKLMTPGGQHIGTLHEIRMPGGRVPHSHPKNYTLRDCSRVRGDVAH